MIADAGVAESATLEQLLETAVRQSQCPPQATTTTQSADANRQLLASIKSEMALFACSGRRGRCLQQTFNFLLSIPPTSVEAERAFSSTGILCSKLRSRLGDATLDTLLFLRAYYCNRNE